MKRPRLVLAMLSLASTAPAESIVFPDDAGVVNIKTAYGATGDGVTDDTAAIQKAIDEVRGIPDTLYFPDGTYLVSDSVGIFNGKAHSRDRFLTYQGQSEAGTVIRLKDSCPGFGDPDKPKIVFSVYEGQGTGDVMHSYVRNLTVDAGKGNPGAVGLRFMTNNSGAVVHVTVRSSDPRGAGKLGLDLRQGQNGPCLIQHVTVEGFDHGVETNDTFSLVFEHLALKNQRVLGFRVHNARTTLRDLRSVNSVPALSLNKNAHLTLVEADCSGGSKDQAAIVSESDKVFLRDVRQAGYGHLLRDASGKVHDDAKLDEWHEGQGHALFGAEPKTLRLPVQETPDIPWETDLGKWAKVEWSKAGDDISEALQGAIDRAAKEGLTTVYIPRKPRTHDYPKLTRPIRVHGAVRRILGMSNILDIADPSGQMKGGAAAFTFEDLAGPAVVVERFFLLGGWKCPKEIAMFENKSGKAVVVRHFSQGGRHKKPSTGGEWFIEDVPSVGLRVGRGETCWARQYNPESPEPDMIEVDGGQLWILGLKTEGRSRHVVARNGAKVELLGGVSYQSWGKQPVDPPMFTVVDSEASFTFGFYHWNQPFTTIVEETVRGETRTLLRKDLASYHLPVYRAGAGKR